MSYIWTLPLAYVVWDLKRLRNKIDSSISREELERVAKSNTEAIQRMEDRLNKIYEIMIQWRSNQI